MERPLSLRSGDIIFAVENHLPDNNMAQSLDDIRDTYKIDNFESDSVICIRQNTAGFLTDKYPPHMEAVIKKICSAIFTLSLAATTSTEIVPSHMNRSFLISASQGSGKSSCLNLLHELFMANIPTAHVIRLDGNMLFNRDIVDHNIHGYTSFGSLGYTQDGSEIFQVIELLANCFGCTGEVGPGAGIQGKVPIRNKALILILDEIDDLLIDEAESLKDVPSVVEANDDISLARRAACYYLRRILSILNSTSNSSVTVVASTRLARNSPDMPASLAPPIGFSEILDMSNPNEEGRFFLLRELLGASPPHGLGGCISWTEEESSSDGSNAVTSSPAGTTNCAVREVGTSSVERYARRLASLTSGYVAGDLARLVQTAIHIAAGRARAAAYHGNRVGSMETAGHVTLTWQDLASAAGAVQPQTLLSLGALGGCMTGSLWEGGRRLTWADVGGYEPQKEVLRRLLGRALGQVRAGDTASRVSGCTLSLRKALGEVKGIGLFGPSGCGKTLLGRVVAAEVRCYGLT